MTEAELQSLRAKLRPALELQAQIDGLNTHLSCLSQKLDPQIRGELVMSHTKKRDELVKRITIPAADLEKQNRRCAQGDHLMAVLNTLAATITHLEKPTTKFALATPTKPLVLQGLDEPFFAKQRQQLLEWALAQQTRAKDAFAKL